MGPAIVIKLRTFTIANAAFVVTTSVPNGLVAIVQTQIVTTNAAAAAAAVWPLTFKIGKKNSTKNELQHESARDTEQK